MHDAEFGTRVRPYIAGDGGGGGGGGGAGLVFGLDGGWVDVTQTQIWVQHALNNIAGVKGFELGGAIFTGVLENN